MNVRDPRRQERIVRERGADAYRHRVGLGAPAMGTGAARIARDPPGVARARGDLAVERHRGLEDDRQDDRCVHASGRAD